MGHTRWDTGLKVDCCRVWQKSKINHVYRVPCNFLCISIRHHFLKEPPLPTSVKRPSHNPLRNGRFLIQVNEESHKKHIKDLLYVNRISTSPVLSLVWQRTHSNFQPQKWTTCELLCAECLEGLLTEKSSRLSGKSTAQEIPTGNKWNQKEWIMVSFINTRDKVSLEIVAEKWIWRKHYVHV